MRRLPPADGDIVNTNSSLQSASDHNLPIYYVSSNKLIVRMVLLVGIFAAELAGFPVSGMEPDGGLSEASRQFYKGNNE